MKPRNCIIDPEIDLIADSSVIINLVATRKADVILRALPNRVAALDEVRSELERVRQKSHCTVEELSILTSKGYVRGVSLNERSQRIFRRLIAGPSVNTLGDGEAATIAYGVEQGAISLLDERKAKRVAAELYPNLKTSSTVDVLLHREVKGTLGQDGLAEAMFNALRDGRMRVPFHYVTWVVNLIGADRAAECPSLPRFLRN